MRDRETGEQLALERLLRADTQSVLRLKREFRSLADIHHPNLVKLYELGRVRDRQPEQAARSVATQLKALAGSRRGDARAEASRIRARLALLRHDQAAAVRDLEASSAGFDAWGARDHAARDRYALGAVIGGARGEQLMRDALAVLGQLGIVDPLRHMHCYFSRAADGGAMTYVQVRARRARR